jgi:predicted AlkP superfamily pyrophosphatase or phosphodiesterase
MARRLVVLNVVGLTPALVGPDTPHLAALARSGAMAPVGPVLPAVTCPVQATYLTGLLPRDHGIVGNGWYFRDLAEVMFWRQASPLLGGERLWQAARRRDSTVTCANLF